MSRQILIELALAGLQTYTPDVRIYESLTPEEWDNLVDLADHHGVAPMADAAVIANGISLPPEAATALDCGNTKGQPLTVGYSTLTSPTAPAPGSFITGVPTAGTRWLRWSVPNIGVNTTGCACFRVTVN